MSAIIIRSRDILVAFHPLIIATPRRKSYHGIYRDTQVYKCFREIGDEDIPYPILSL